MTNTTTNIRFSSDTVRAHGLTVDSVAALFADGEWPLSIREERAWDGRPAIVVELTTETYDADADASSDELVECAERTGLRHTVGWTISEVS